MGTHAHRALIGGGFAALAAGAACMLTLHLGTGLDPVHGLISEYAFEPQGWLLAASLTCFAAGAALFASVAPSRPVAALVAVWGACMLLAAAFPTDRPGVPLSMSGGIHRYAALIAFIVMPLAGLLLARRLGRSRTAYAVRALSVVALVFLISVVVPYLLRFAGIPVTNEDIPAGLTQRMVVLSEVGVLVLLGLVLAGGALAGSAVKRGLPASRGEYGTRGAWDVVTAPGRRC
jgi:hypothetical protein